MSHAALPVDELATSSRGLEIRVLGPLAVTVDGVPLDVDTRKALAMLAILATERRPFARDELAALLWPESDGESARGALRRTLSVLRAALGNRWLRVDRTTVALDLDRAWVDLAAFEAAAARDDVDALRAARDVARGPFLAGFSLRDSPEFDDWRATRAVAVERSVASALRRLADAAEATGDVATAVDAATRHVQLDPIDEPAQRQLMTLLARSGDSGGAIRQYRACVALLERELGVAPLAETTELYEAIRDGRLAAAQAGAAESSPTAAVGLEPAPVVARLPMIGRDAELAMLLASRRAVRQDGRLALVAGEAGIGKSRLLEELVALVATDGGRSLTGRAFASEEGIPYAPVVDLLRSGLRHPDSVDRLRPLAPATLADLERLVALPPELTSRAGTAPPPPADPPAARARLLEAIAATLAALAYGPSSGLLVVEDVQWLDDASREALAYLARRLDGRPLLLAVAYRPEDLDPRGAAFVDSLRDLAVATSVALHRLEAPDVARLVDAAVGGGSALDVDRLTHESEGLPLYLVEAIAQGTHGTAAGPPRGVRALLRERLATVGETATQVLSAAAVIGRSFDLATVRVASGRSEEETVTALEELIRRGIVRELSHDRETAFDFSHARLREAAYEATSLARRRLLHRRVAEAMRARMLGRDDAGRLSLIAGHQRAAGLDAEAAESYRQAGARARALYANEEAIEHLSNAIGLGHPDVAGLQVEIGELLTARGDYTAAVGALEAAAALVDGPALAGVELRLGRVHARRGDLVTAASHLDAAIEDMGAPDDTRARIELARTFVERATVALRAGDRDAAATTGGRALELAEAASDGLTCAAAHRILGLVARDAGDLEAARRELRRSLELADAGPSGSDDAVAIAARNALALVEAAAGDRGSAIDLLEAALGACRRVGERHLEAAVENNLADQLHAAGRPDEAMVHLKQAVATFAEVGGWPGELEPEIWKLETW